MRHVRRDAELERRTLRDDHVIEGAPLRHRQARIARCLFEPRESRLLLLERQLRRRSRGPRIDRRHRRGPNAPRRIDQAVDVADVDRAQDAPHDFLLIEERRRGAAPTA
jgi:hypothetical protein